MGLIGLDFETYASTDLLKHGLHRYINCTDFQPLIAVLVQRNDAGQLIGQLFDFVEDYTEERLRLIERIGSNTVVAHNAGFEQSVLARMGIDLPSTQFVDSAVLARAAGAAGKLEAAAPQLLGTDKLEIGFELIKLFSIPGKYQEANNNLAFDPQIRIDHMDEWARFAEYCAIDAELSLRIAETYPVSDQELANNAVTMDMNNTGWHVDYDLVKIMHLRYQINLAQLERDFRILTGAYDLNLNSHPQLVEWCKQRGVRATSFDEAHVERLIKTLVRKTSSTTISSDKLLGYEEVLHLLRTKQHLGGSSLKKLATILDTTGEDGRLHDQYLHCGAGATYRTTGRGVQMQNLKRLNGQGDDVELLFEDDTEWDNGRLAANLRQVFTASDPQGQLIVGDFASVESRGLAWQAGEQWKLDAYRKGEDLYKVQAGLMFNRSPLAVTKSQRQIGKVAELACGYGAGPEAVRDFAQKMGVDLVEGEATKLVEDWRAANPRIVQYWERLDEALHEVLIHHQPWRVTIPYGYVLVLPQAAPQSLQDQVKQPLLSLRVSMCLRDGTQILDRVIHGARILGRNIQYWKPSERKTGDLWTDEFVNPKTKRKQKYTVYGGKLAGLLTQSLCREVFFDSLRAIHNWAQPVPNVQLVGQFHDEIVLDWTDDKAHGVSLQWTKDELARCMTTTKLPAFPLAAEIKSDYRYTK